MGRIAFRKSLIFKTILLFFIIRSAVLAQDINQTYVNRLTKISLSFYSTAPIEKEPYYLLPAKTKIITNFLTCNFDENGYHYRWDLFLFFEQEGNYEVGPFIFHNIENKPISLSPVKFSVSNTEPLTLVLKRKTEKFLDIPPKFKILRINEVLYPFTPVYLTLELDNYYDSIQILWSGWEDAVVERLPDELDENKRYQIRFMVLFIKSGTYNLKPLKFKLERDGKSYGFSSPPFIFFVKDIENLMLNYPSDMHRRVNAYAATNQNQVIIEADYYAKGYLKFYKPLKPLVSEDIPVLLKDYNFELISTYPELQTRAKYSYFFLPKKEGSYEINLPEQKSFDYTKGVFKSISSTVFHIKVMMPANPLSTEQMDIEKNLSIKRKIDYDLYAIMVLIFLGTFTIVGLSIKTLFKKTSSKRMVAFNNISAHDELSLILRSFLVVLSKKSGKDLLMAPLSEIESELKRLDIPKDKKIAILNWLQEVYRAIYLKQSTAFKRKILKEKGMEFLKIIS